MMEQNEMIDTVFKRSDNPSSDNFTQGNIRAFNMLMAIDGTRSVGKIAREDSYQIEDLVEIFNQMLDQGLIEPATATESSAGRDAFFQELETLIGQIMGPVGTLIIQEKISESGHTASDFPMARAHELISQLSLEIADESEAQRFKRQMTAGLG